MRTTSQASRSGPTTATSMIDLTKLIAGAKSDISVPDEGVGGTVVRVDEKTPVFAQGDLADAVFYVRKGLVRLSVVSENGKEAVLAAVGEGQFFGESCLAGAPVRVDSATAMTSCELLRVERDVMRRALQQNRGWADLFVSKMLARNVRYEEDLIDQLLNCSEKRLARTLLLLGRVGDEAAREAVVLQISQETLAEMVGTTRSRVNAFMNGFRSLGYIDYSASGLHVHPSLLNVVLR